MSSNSQSCGRELLCPVEGCDYATESPQGIAGHVGNGHTDGWDATDSTPIDVHQDATVRDEDAFCKASRVRAYLTEHGVSTDAIRIYWHYGYDNVQILVTGSLGDEWDAFREATDVEGIQYVGDGRSYCTAEFIERLPAPRAGEFDKQLTTGRETREDAVRDTAACTAHSCWRDGRPFAVDGETAVEAVLCETHAKAFLGVSS